MSALLSFLLSLSFVAGQNLTYLMYWADLETHPVPYIVSLQTLKKNNQWYSFCGGSIISPNYILTAAHCLVYGLDRFGSNKVRIIAGQTHLKRNGGSRHFIVRYTRHPAFRPFKGYDIGLIKVKPDFKLNGKTISKINFESTEKVLEHEEFLFHGWGDTERHYPYDLQMAYFTMISNKACVTKAPNYSLLSSDFCAESKTHSFPAKGDSGGPLVNLKQNLQVGICSYSVLDENHKVPYPTVFTKVSEFGYWIKHELAK